MPVLKTSPTLRNSFFTNARNSALQFTINQGTGLFLFFLLSRYLDKTEFGELNWTLAVFLTLFNVLPSGLDQVSVQKIAAGNHSPKIPSIYLFHIALTGLSFYGLIFLASSFLPGLFDRHFLLLLLGFGKLLLFFSTPFKQIVTGLERFNLLVYMATVSNLIKTIVLIYLAVYGELQLHQVVTVFVLADGLEFLVSVILYRYFIPGHRVVIFSRTDYISFLKECLPQAGVALFSSALSRLDWILIGVFLTMNRLGEYSFAYKVFELSTLPLLIIAPLLVPLFSRYLGQGRMRRGEMKFKLLLKLEIAIACLTTLVLNVCWVPLVDRLTQGQYGQANATTIFLLSLSVPLLYLNNFLWSLHFSAGRQKLILRIFLSTFLINLALNAFLIPLLQNHGAAIAFSISILLQTVLYSLPLKKETRPGWQSLLACSATAMLAGWTGTAIFSSLWQSLPLSVFFYILLLFLTRQFRLRDGRRILQAIVIKKQPVA